METLPVSPKNDEYNTGLVKNQVWAKFLYPRDLRRSDYYCFFLLFFFAEVARTVVSDELGLVDFHPSSGTAVLYATEVDIVNESPLKRKIVKLRKVRGFSNYFFYSLESNLHAAENTRKHRRQFEIQKAHA